MTDTSVEVVEYVPPTAGIVRAAASVPELVEAQAEYQELCRSLLTDDDYQHIQGKSFRKKSGWRKLNVAFNVSMDLLAEDYTYDEDGKIRRAKVTVRATAPNGRHADGIGLCSRTERRFTKPEHDIPATAYTRAANRASSDLYGLGEVSAEEMDYDGPLVRRGRRRHSAPEVTDPDAVTPDQLTKIHTMFSFLDMTDRDVRLKYASAIVNRDVASSKDLTKREASKLIDALEHEAEQDARRTRGEGS